MQATNERGVLKRRSKLFRTVRTEWVAACFGVFIGLCTWCVLTTADLVILYHDTETKTQIATATYHNTLIRLNQKAIYLLMQIEKNRLVAPKKGTRI